MHPSSMDSLVEHLQHLVIYGSSSDMLAVTVKTTSDGLLVGVADGELRLDYPQAGWLDFRRAYKFRSFCSTNSLSVTKERWGREIVYRAAIGREPKSAAEAIDHCFATLYGHTGPYALKLQATGWSPSNYSLKRTAANRLGVD